MPLMFGGMLGEKMKPRFDARCSPRIAGPEISELFNAAIDRTQTPEERQLAKNHLAGYASRGPDSPYAEYLTRVLDWYADNPKEIPTPIRVSDIPRFSPPRRKVSQPIEEPFGMWDF
jgi:hypothetical protein